MDTRGEKKTNKNYVSKSHKVLLMYFPVHFWLLHYLGPEFSGSSSLEGHVLYIKKLMIS